MEVSGAPPDSPAARTTLRVPLKLFVRGKPGALDTTYGVGGASAELFGQVGSVYTADLVIAPDDSVFVVALCGAGSLPYAVTEHTCVARIDPTGKLDSSYGNGGLAEIGVFRPNQAALQADGKLVVVGGSKTEGEATPSPATIGRLDAKGKPDPTFGLASVGPGINVFTTGGLSGENDGLVGVALRSDGDIFVAWQNYDSGPAVDKNGSMRLGSDGRLKTEYAGGGTTRTAVGLSTAIAVRNDPKLPSFGNVALLWVSTTGAGAINMSQTDANTAAPDTLFGPIRSYPLAGSAHPTRTHNGLVQLGDGSIVTPFVGVAGVYLAKLTAKGALDASFSGAGLAGPYPLAVPAGIAMQSDGKFLVALATTNPEVVRFTATGTIDTPFGAFGHAKLADAGFGRKVVVQKNGRILVSTTKAAATSTSGVSAFWP